MTKTGLGLDQPHSTLDGERQVVSVLQWVQFSSGVIHVVVFPFQREAYLSFRASHVSGQPASSVPGMKIKTHPTPTSPPPHPHLTPPHPTPPHPTPSVLTLLSLVDFKQVFELKILGVNQVLSQTAG